jgi:hypothetical protein
MNTQAWITAASSVRGKGHEQTGTPCQDASLVLASADGEWVALVASDGAGSAEYAEVGSSTVTKHFADALIRLAPALANRNPGEWIIDAVLASIIDIRDELRTAARSDSLKAYHCTLVACLIGPTGGFSIHIGDGSIFGGIAENETSTTIDLSRRIFISAPQNGEYANETVFITEREWIKNLRIQPIPKLDWVMLGTDGGMALAMNNDTVPKTGFVAPVLSEVIRSANLGSSSDTLRDILSDKQADRLTNDDKTLVIAIRRTFKTVLNEIDPAKIQGDAIHLRPEHPSQSSIQSGSTPSHLGTDMDQRPSSKKSIAQSKVNRKINWYLLTVLLMVTTVVTAAGTYQFSKYHQAQELHTKESQRSANKEELAPLSEQSTIKSLGTEEQKQVQATPSSESKNEASNTPGSEKPPRANK